MMSHGWVMNYALMAPLFAGQGNKTLNQFGSLPW